MTLIYLGIYTLLLVLIWGFFIVAKIHSYKFKNFSNYIVKVTNFLLIFLIVLSVLGYVIIIFMDNKSTDIKFLEKDAYFNEVTY
ncbi:MAG: hypothetical protein PHH98_02540 [Candidatus Gracilibacteria bacterium]|nr:hypothetical protein [Candidatus Gracilibacteria bacterium]